MALNIEKNPSSRLAGNDLRIIFKTGSWVLRDWPKSKCNIFLIYEKYWFIKGSFSPNLFLRYSLETSSAPYPSMASTGSPGATLNKTKTNEEIIHNIIGINEIFNKE